MSIQTQDNNKRIAKNTLLLYLRHILIMAVSLYSSRLVLQALGVEDYGVYNVVGGMVVMFSFLNNALANATQRYIAFGIAKDSIEKQQQTFSMLLNVHILIAVVLFILCETLGLWLFYHKLVIPQDKLNDAFGVMQCSIVTLMFSVTQVPYNASIFGHEKMEIYAYISIFEALLKMLIAISLFFFIDKLSVYGIMIMSAQLVVALIYRFYCHQNFRNCVYIRFWSKGLFKELLSFSGWSLIGNFAWTLNEQGMNILINMFFGPVYNAARGVASQVSAAITSFTTNFLGASAPQITKYYAVGDYVNCINLCNRSTKFGFFLFMLIELPLVSIIQPVLSVWLVEVPPLTGCFCMLSLLYVQTRTLGGTLQQLVQATGKVRFFQLAQGLTALITMPLVYILYRMYFPVSTYLYVMIGMTVINVTTQVMAVHHIFPYYSIRFYLKEVILPVLLCFPLPFMFSLYSFSTTHSVTSAILSCGGVFILSFLSVWFIGMKTNEREWITNLIKAKIRK